MTIIFSQKEGNVSRANRSRTAKWVLKKKVQLFREYEYKARTWDVARKIVDGDDSPDGVVRHVDGEGSMQDDSGEVIQNCRCGNGFCPSDFLCPDYIAAAK